MKREFRDYLQDILDDMDGVAAFTRDLTYEAFAQDRKTVSAVTEPRSPRGSCEEPSRPRS